MELNNEFEVDRPISDAWALLTDVERIAPCLPGAQLEEIEGEEFRGSVKVKVGPITANYKGKATFIEKDDVNHKVVLRAEGRDARQGNANATITATLVSVGSGTKVSVSTDLAVTGKVAQFGRGVMAEVSEKLLKQFVVNLEAKVLAEGSAPSASPVAAAPTSPVPTQEAADHSEPTVRRIAPTAPVEPVDLLGATGAPLLKRLAPVLVGVLALFVVMRWLRRRGG